MLPLASLLPGVPRAQLDRSAPPVAVASRRINGVWTEVLRYTRHRKGQDVAAVIISPQGSRPS
jgi:hypothetical protein